MAGKGYTRRQVVATGTAGAVAGALGGAEASAEPVARGSHKRRKLKADVAVVGAGFAGLTAAREIEKGGRSVIVLEARRRVGGRVLTHDLGDGKIAELGGTYAGPTQNHIFELAKEVGVANYKAFNTGDNVFYANGRRSTYADDTPLGTAPNDPIVAPDTIRAVALLDVMSEDVPVGAPWAADDAAELDSKTLHTFLKENSSSPEFLPLASAATSAIFGSEPRDISLLYTLFYIAASGDENNAGTFERNFNTRGGAQESRFVGGAQSIAIKVAERLGDSIIFHAPARRIEQKRGGGVTVYSDHLQVSAQRVIVAIPPALAGRIQYRPFLPPLRDQLTQRLPQGSLMKFEALYDKPWWRDKGLNGTAVSENGPVKVVFDGSPREGTPGILMGFIGGHDARFWARRSAKSRRAAALDNFVKYFGEEARNPREVLEFNWSAEVWNRGGPVALLPPGALYDFGPALRKPVEKIHWAGTETSTYWNGYIDGAVRSGERAAAEVLKAL